MAKIKQNNLLLELAILAILLILGFLFLLNYQNKKDSKPILCGGIANIKCPNGYSCNIPAIYPDAGGTCTKNLF